MAAAVPRPQSPPSAPAIKPVPRKFSDDRELERHECKYLIHPALVPDIRRYVMAFCERDRHGMGPTPEYTATTLQLDNLSQDLARAKEREVNNRFKLRIRTYGEACDGPVFIEIKRKVNGVVRKSRAILPAGTQDLQRVLDPNAQLPFRGDHDRMVHLEFARLAKTIGAQPLMHLQYLRESWVGTGDRYARVTFDRALRYRPARAWDWPQPGARWRTMDTSTAFSRERSAVILELKTGGDMALWMQELIHRFQLVRVGFCKYAVALRLDSLALGAQYSDASENCTY